LEITVHTFQLQCEFHTDPAIREHSRTRAFQLVLEALEAGISPEHLLRCCLPKLSISRLEAVLSLIHDILEEKREAATRWPTELPYKTPTGDKK
jgi:hypothetical protein